MLAILLLCATVTSAPRTPAPAPGPSPPLPPIRVSLSDDGHYRPGDRVTVHLQTRDDGYIVVLHVDADQHLRVLFPRNPDDDNSVRGGQEIEILGRGGRQAITVDRPGQGVVYAAVSRNPFRFDSSYVVDGHWDLRALDSVEVSRDPEADLTDLVRGMAQAPFDYDLVRYDVSREVASAAPYYGPYVGGFGYPFYGPYAAPQPFFGLGFGFTFGHVYGPGFPVYRRFYRVH